MKKNIYKIKKILSSKVAKNLSWLTFDKIFRATFNFILTVIIARYLGPDQFGLLSYLFSILFLLTTISSFGINPILIRDITISKNFYLLIFNGYFLRFFISTLCYSAFIIFNYIYFKNDTLVIYYSILGLTLIFKSSEVLFSYFEAKLLSKFIVLSQIIGALTLFIVQALIIIFHLDFRFVIISFLVETIITFILINIFFFKIVNFDQIKIKIDILKSLVNQSYPVLISAISIIIYMRIDQVMIQYYLGNKTLGLYSSATRLIEIFHFIPKIFMISIIPILIKVNRVNETKYNIRLKKINYVFFILSIVIVSFVFLLSDYLILFLYGHSFLEASNMLKILSLSLIFVYIGVVNEHWYITNNYQKLYARNIFIGAILNIILNILLIPLFGAIGAATSTIITYIIIIYFCDYLDFRTRKLFFIKLFIKS